MVKTYFVSTKGFANRFIAILNAIEINEPFNIVWIPTNECNIKDPEIIFKSTLIKKVYNERQPNDIIITLHPTNFKNIKKIELNQKLLNIAKDFYNNHKFVYGMSVRQTDFKIPNISSETHDIIHYYNHFNNLDGKCFITSDQKSIRNSFKDNGAIIRNYESEVVKLHEDEEWTTSNVFRSEQSVIDAVIDAIIIGHVNITRPNFEKYDNGNLRKSTFVYFQHYMKQLLN